MSRMFDLRLGRAAQPEPEPEPATERGLSKAELLQQIDQLKERNERYELRFRDVVQAYKSILKEKQALEGTVTALTSNGGHGEDDDGADDATATATASVTAGEPAEAESATTESGAEDASGRVSQLKKALATLSAEKKVMTERFQADKRQALEQHRQDVERLRLDLDEQATKHAQEMDERDEVLASRDRQIESLRTQLDARSEELRQADTQLRSIKATHARELERQAAELAASSDLALQSADLQKQVRMARERELDALARIDEARREGEVAIARREAEKQALQAEIDRLNARKESEILLRYKKDLRAARHQIEYLQDQLEQAAADKARMLEDAQQRILAMEQTAVQSEQQLAQMQTEFDRERSAYEAHSAEHANLIGRYEEWRQRDDRVAQELRMQLADMQERYDALETRLTALHSSGNGANSKVVAQLEAKVKELEQQLLANQSHPHTVHEAKPGSADPAALGTLVPPPWLTQLLNNNQKKSYSAFSSPDQLFAYQCYTRLQTCEEELQSAKEQAAAMEHQKQRLSETVQEVRQELREQLQGADNEWRATVDKLRTEHKLALEALHQDMSASLQAQQETRERTMALLSDKDAEIARLRRKSQHNSVSTPSDGDSVPQLATGEPQLHLLAQQDEMRERLSFLQAQVEELEQALVHKEDERINLLEKMQSVQAEADRLQRNSRREGANLEYLKNVVLQFLLNDVGQLQKLRAIATILQFSDQEARDSLAAFQKMKRSSWF